MLLVWLFLAGVILCVAVAIILTRKGSGSLGVKPLTFLAIIMFCTSFLGFLVTGFSSPTLESWWQALLVRVGWQLGSAIFLAVMILFEDPSQRTLQIFALVLLTIGLAVTFNPMRDLVQGPLRLRGKMDLSVFRTHIAYRGGPKIYADLQLTAADGSQTEINMAGWGATEAIEKLEGCHDGDTVEVIVLRHLERVLDARCQL